MTDEQINAAIAKACGITRKYGIEDYVGDLNAMHEAEESLSQRDMYVMAIHIEAISKGFHFRATARQRAEAFLRTLGKWGSTTEDSSAVQKEALE